MKGLVLAVMCCALTCQAQLSIRPHQGNTQFAYVATKPNDTSSFSLPEQGQFITISVRAIYLPTETSSVWKTIAKRFDPHDTSRILLVSEVEQDINDPQERGQGPRITRYFLNFKKGQVAVGNIIVEGPTYWHQTNIRVHFYLYGIKSVSTFGDRKANADKVLQKTEALLSSLSVFGPALKALPSNINDKLSTLIANARKNNLIVDPIDLVIKPKGSAVDMAIASDDLTYVYPLAETDNQKLEEGDQLRSNFELYSKDGARKDQVAYVVFSVEKTDLDEGLQILLSKHTDQSNSRQIASVVDELNQELPQDLQVGNVSSDDYSKLLSRKVYSTLAFDLKRHLTVQGSELTALNKFIDRTRQFANNSYFGFHFSNDDSAQASRDIASLTELDGAAYNSTDALLKYISAVKSRLIDAKFDASRDIFTMKTLSGSAIDTFKTTVAALDIHDEDFSARYQNAFNRLIDVSSQSLFPSESDELLQFLRALTGVNYSAAADYKGWMATKVVCSTPEKIALFGNKRDCINQAFTYALFKARQLPSDLLTAIKAVYEAALPLDTTTATQVKTDMLSRFVPAISPPPYSYDDFTQWAAPMNLSLNGTNIMWEDAVLAKIREAELFVGSNAPTLDLFNDIAAESDKRSSWNIDACTAFLRLLNENTDFESQYPATHCNPTPRVVKTRFKAWVAKGPKLDDLGEKLTTPLQPPKVVVSSQAP